MASLVTPASRTLTGFARCFRGGMATHSSALQLAPLPAQQRPGTCHSQRSISSTVRSDSAGLKTRLSISASSVLPWTVQPRDMQEVLRQSTRALSWSAPRTGLCAPAAVEAGGSRSHVKLGGTSPPFRLMTLPFALLERFVLSTSPFRRNRLPGSGSERGSIPTTSGPPGGSGRRPPNRFPPPPLLGALILRLNRIPSNYLLNLLIGLNALVFLGWMYAQSCFDRFRDPRPMLFMMSNFLCGESNLSNGRWWTLFTACVSHSDTGHFAINMLSLFFMATPVMAVAGNATFLALYFGAGLASTTFSLLWHRYADPWFDKGGRGTKGFSLGASGSVYAIMSTFACLQPRAMFLLFFVVPVPAWLCVSGIFAWDLYTSALSPGGKTDGAGHVGGILAGLLFWRFGLRGLRY